MPTVRPDIRPVVVFPAPRGSFDKQRLTIFPAEAWEKWGGKEGQFRVMEGERWVTRPGESVSFFTLDGVGELVRRWALEELGCEAAGDIIQRARPDLRPGSPVWVHEGEQPQASRTRAEPFLDSHGEWRVWVLGVKHAVLLDDLRPRKVGHAS